MRGTNKLAWKSFKVEDCFLLSYYNEFLKSSRWHSQGWLWAAGRHMRDKVADVTTETQERWENKNKRENRGFAHSWTPKACEFPTGSTDEHSVVSGWGPLSICPTRKPGEIKPLSTSISPMPAGHTMTSASLKVDSVWVQFIVRKLCPNKNCSLATNMDWSRKRTSLTGLKKWICRPEESETKS